MNPESETERLWREEQEAWLRLARAHQTETKPEAPLTYDIAPSDRPLHENLKKT